MSSSDTLIAVSICQRNIFNYNKAETHLKKLVSELTWLLPNGAQPFIGVSAQGNQIEVNTTAAGTGGDSSTIVTNILVPLLLQDGVVVAAFAGIHTVISKLIEREAASEVTIEANGKKLTIKGKKIPSAEEMIKAVFPELDLKRTVSAQTRLQATEELYRKRDPEATVKLRRELTEEETSENAGSDYTIQY